MDRIRTLGKLLAYPIALIGMYLIGIFAPGGGWAMPILTGGMWFSICHIAGLALIDSAQNEKQEMYLYYLQKQHESKDKPSD